MGKKCCGKLSKLGIDYSGINRIPYFGKRKDRDAWIRKQKAEAKKAQEEAIAESQKTEPTQEEPQIDQSIEDQKEYPEVEFLEEDVESEIPEDHED